MSKVKKRLIALSIIILIIGALSFLIANLEAVARNNIVFVVTVISVITAFVMIKPKGKKA